jgi:hypothetical protein
MHGVAQLTRLRVFIGAGLDAGVRLREDEILTASAAAHTGARVCTHPLVPDGLQQQKTTD